MIVLYAVGFAREVGVVLPARGAPRPLALPVGSIEASCLQACCSLLASVLLGNCGPDVSKESRWGFDGVSTGFRRESGEIRCPSRSLDRPGRPAQRWHRRLLLDAGASYFFIPGGLVLGSTRLSRADLREDSAWQVGTEGLGKTCSLKPMDLVSILNTAKRQGTP